MEHATQYTIFVYIGLTLIIGGGAAFRMGRNFAENWRPFWHVLAAGPGLALGVRFLHYALFEEALLTGPGYVLDALTITALAALGFRMARTQAMVTRYYWLYEKTSPISWRERQPEA
jgi:hypothetical protein